MCGIVGVATRWPNPQVCQQTKEMLKNLEHRGRDGDGFFSCETGALGHTRLAILDQAGGDQPFFLDDLVFVGNGEIYNYVELKQDLPGIDFKTGSDMEPMLYLYQRHGLDFVKLLRGMFAIAIYDQAKKELILARDPFGIKPLYYTQTATGFFFASEILPLLNIGVAARDLSPEQVEELLQLRFTTGAETPFRDIKRVLPGEVIRVCEGGIVNAQIRTVPLWEPAKPVEPDVALKELDHHLAESMKLHLRCDAPYGLFLSGGVDSATLLYLMGKLTGKAVETFTVTFPESAKHDEGPQAKAVAQACGANHHEIPFTEADFWELLPKIAQLADDPFLDYAALPTYKMAGVAKAKGMKVMLCGEGADELLAGYRRYQKASWPSWLGGRVFRKQGNFSKTRILRHPTDHWKQRLQETLQTLNVPSLTRLQQAQGMDIKTWLSCNLLNRLDRCLMVQGLEGRTPFLEPVLSSFLFSLPDKLKLHQGYRKWILRQWLKERLPQARPFAKKQGFTYPAETWVLKQGEKLGNLLATHPAIEAICFPDEVRMLFKTNAKHNGFLAWSLLFYALWYRYHIRNLPMEGTIWELLG